MTDRTKYVDGIPVGLTDQDGTDARFSVDVNVTSGSISSSGITQYTEGDVDASITGTAVMWEDAANTLRSVSAAKPLPVSMASDIQIGAVEIKDHDSATRLDVETVTTKNALYDRSEDGAHPTIGTTTDAAASSSVAEDATARTGIGLWKGIKNILILLNAKFVSGTDIGDVTVNNAAAAGVYTRPGTSATFPVSAASGQVASGAIASGAMVAGSQVDGHSATLGLTTAPAAAAGTVEDATARTGIGLFKGIKNLLKLINDKLVTGTVIGDVNVAAITAGETHIGEVATPSKQIQVTPTITAGAYSIGDVIGGIQTLTAAARVNATCTTLDTLTIRDKAMQDADIKLWFFDQNPTSGSYDDNDALDIDDADLAFCLGCLRMLSSDYDDASDNSIATLRNQGLKMTPTGGTNDLYAIAEIETADSYASTSDLTFVYEFSQD